MFSQAKSVELKAISGVFQCHKILFFITDAEGKKASLSLVNFSILSLCVKSGESGLEENHPRGLNKVILEGIDNWWHIM